MRPAVGDVAPQEGDGFANVEISGWSKKKVLLDLLEYPVDRCPWAEKEEVIHIDHQKGC